ncbi:hybrid signal transduction histidine kinase M, partial [Tanacetum coccineum]
FSGGFYEPSKLIFTTHVRTRFLSPGTPYTVNLVFKNKKPKERYIGLEYKIKDGKKSYSFLADERKDAWLSAELYQLTSDGRAVDLNFLFDCHAPTFVFFSNFLVEGIEFQPQEEDQNVETQPILEPDTYWNENLPSDDKDRENCLMLATRAALKDNRWRWKSLPKTRPSQPIPKTLNHQTSPRFNSRTPHSAMTNSNTPPPPPALTLVEKLYAVHNINSLIPEKLDLQESNYSTWSYFFKGHCSNFNVLNHIDGSTSTSDPPTDEWITADSIVKSWIFLTLSPTLRKRMISTNPASAKAAWDTIETIFQENKRTRTVALKGELRVIQMGDDTPDAYFSKIDSIITLLTDLGSTMDDDDIVTYAINGLSEKYGSLAQIIAHKDPFPDLATVRTMVTTEEMRLRSKQPILSTSTTSSSPQVLLATSQPRIQDNRNNRDRDARNENKTEICRNFGRGYCRWGTNCRFIHASPKGTNNPRPNSSQHNTRSMQQGPGHTGLNSASQQHLLSLIQAQQNLLAQYGLSISQGQQPVQHNNTMGLRPNAPPGFQQTQPHQPTFGFNGHQQALYSAAVQNQSASSGSTSQETQLPHAFNTLTLQDPANSNWNMDTGASSHLNSSVNNLSTIFNSRIYPSVLVGDGKSIPVTNTGHSTLPTPYRTLHLNNVLITPNIVKNLISVRQFVRENKCTIEFDEFGFSVKDFISWTRQFSQM